MQGKGTIPLTAGAYGVGGSEPPWDENPSKPGVLGHFFPLARFCQIPVSYDSLLHVTHLTNTGQHVLRKGFGVKNPTGLAAQLERHHEASYGWALSCCDWDDTEAEDVLQTAYLKVVAGRARFEGRSAFKTWLFGVIRRTAQETSRRTRSHQKRALRLVRDDDQVVEAEDVEGKLERAEQSRRLKEALQQLSDRQREVLTLVFYQDLSIAEAAEVVGIGLGSARTHYERGKSRLRALLTEGDTRGQPATGS